MHVPSTIVSIPDSCVHHPPSAQQSTRQLLVAGKRREGLLDSVIIRRPEGLHSTQHPKASIIVHIPAFALRRPPQKLLLWRSPPVVARKQRCSDVHEGATEATQYARETDNQLHGRAPSDACRGHCLDQGPRDVHQGHHHGQIHCGRHHDQAPGDVHQSHCHDQATGDVHQGCHHDQATGDVHQGCCHDEATTGTSDQPGHHPDHAPGDVHQGCLHDGTCNGIRWGHHLHGGAPSEAQQGHHLHNAIAGSHASIPFSPSLRESEQVYTGHQTTGGCHMCCDSFRSVHPDHLVCTPPCVAEDGHQHRQPAMPQNGDIPSPHQQNSCHHHHHRSELEPPRFCADSFTQVEAILPQDIHYTDHGRSLLLETHLRTADPGLSVTRETLPGEQNSAPRHHQALLNSSHSVPLDVLELIRRLRAVAKERMIENTVAKLINCQFSGANEESAASSMSGSPGPVGTAKTEECWKDELCKMEQCPPRASEFGAAADGAEEEGACGSPSTVRHSHASSPDHHHSCPRSAAALGSRCRHELQDCGILCEPSPANQKREKGCDSQKLNSAYNRLGPPTDPSQAETDTDTSVEESPYSDSTADEAGPCRVSAADNQSLVTAPRGARWVSSLADSSKCVPPVVLKRQVGALRKKFKVVRHQDTPRVVMGKTTATRKRAGKKSVHRITKKFKRKNFQLQSNKLMKMFSTEVNDSEWKKKKGLRVDIAMVSAKESFPFPARFELAADMWQSSGLTHAQVMVLSTDNSSSSQGATRGALSAPTAAHLGTCEVSETISALIGPCVPEGDLEAYDSDVIVEQIDKLLSESSSPLRVKDSDSFRVDEPAQDTKQDAQLSSGASSLKPIPSSVETSSSSANQEKCESSHVECSNRTRVRQSRKKGPPYNSIKLQIKKTHSVCLSDERSSDGASERSSAIAASKCSDTEPVCEDFEQRLVESATSVPQASPGSLASALQRFEILHPHVLKSCSVVLSDLKNTKLLLNLKASCKTECDENKGSTNTACGYQSSRKLTSNRKKHSAKTSHDFYSSEKGNTVTTKEDSASTTGKKHAGTTGKDSASTTGKDSASTTRKDSASVAERDDASVTEKEGASTTEKEGACTTFPAALSVMPTESASVHGQLENNQPLEQAVFISLESETGNRKQRAASEQMCHITNQCLESTEERKHSRSLQAQKVKEKSQPAQDEHPGSVQPTSRPLRKADSSSAGTLAKQHPSSLRKQGGVEAKRKVKPSGKTSASGVTKQVGVPQSHSWEDVLELMNSLSGSSCTNKPPAEAVRTSLPRIPKRSKCSSDSACTCSSVASSVSEGQADSKQTEREKPATADPDPSASSGKSLGFGGLDVVRPGQSEHRSVSSPGSLASTVSRPEPESASGHVGTIRETVCSAVHSVTTASSNPCQVSVEAFPVNKCSSMPVGCQLPIAWPGNKLTHSWRPSPTLHGHGSISTQAVGEKDLASSQSLTALHVAQSVSALEQTIKSVVESIKSQQRPGSVHIPCSGTGNVPGPRSVTDHLASSSGNQQSSLRSSGIPRDPRRGAKGYVGTAQPAQSVSVPRCVQTESTACQALSATRPSDLMFSEEVKIVQSNAKPEPCFVSDNPAAEWLHKYAVSRGHQSEPEPSFVSDNPAAESLHKYAVSQGHHPQAAMEVDASPEKGLIKTVLSSLAQEHGCGPTTLKSPREQKQEHKFLSHPKTAQEQEPNGSDEAKSSHLQSATEDQVETEIPTDRSGTGGEVETDQEQLSKKAPAKGIAPQETDASWQGPPGAIQELTEVKALQESSGPSQTAAGIQTAQEMTKTRALQESAAAAQALTEAVCTRKAAQALQEQTEVDFTHGLVEDTKTGVSDLTGASLPDTSARSAVVQGAFSHSVASLPETSACSSGNQASEKNHGPKNPRKFQDEEEDEAFSFSSAEYFTVIDECGDPDAVWNMPVSNVVVRHLDLERRLRDTYTGGKASKSEDVGTSGRKKDPDDERKSTNAKQSSKMGRKRPQIHPNYYSFFAKTVVKAHEENQKIDMEQKKRMANKASLFKSQTASSRNLSSSDLMLENRQARRSRSSEQKWDCRRHAAKGSRLPSNQLKRKSRSPSIPKRARSGSPYDRRRSRSPLYQQRSGSAHECRRSRSPHRRRLRSPVEQLRKKSKSPTAWRRPGSVSPDVQQRSRSPSVWSRVGSPSGRGDDRGYQPARGHVKEQVAEDRQGRRYRPYGGRQDRDSRSERQERGTDCDWQRRWGTEHKPIASFQLAYKELNELLADKTSQTFQRRMVDPSDDRRPLESFSRKRYLGKRFQGYRFQRSKIPSLAEFRTCKCKVLASLERRVTEMVETDIDSGEEEREEAQEAERARLAQVLDEMMGEAEEPRQKESTEQNVIDQLHVQIANPVSASTFVCNEVQDSHLLTDGTGSSAERFPVGTHSASSVGSEPKESSSNVSMQVASDSVLLAECEEPSSKSQSLSRPPVVLVTDQGSEKSANCHLASQTAQRRVINPNTGTEVHFGGGQHEQSSGQPKKSNGEILEEYYRQRLIKLHEERQRQFKVMGQQGSNHSRKKSGHSKASGCNDARPDTAHQFEQRRQRHSSEPSHPQESSTSDNQSASEHQPGRSRHQSHSSGRFLHHPHGLSQSLPQVMARDMLQSSRADPSGQRTPPGPCPDDSPSNISPVVPRIEPRIGPRTPPRPGQLSAPGKRGHLRAPWPALGPTDPRPSHQQRCAAAGPQTPLGTSPGSDDGGITALRQTRRGPRTPPGPGPDDDGAAVDHVSGLEHLCSCSDRRGQKAPPSASVGMKGDGSAQPQPLQAAAASRDADSGTALKIIKAAKLSASAGQTSDHLPEHPPGPRAAAGGSSQTGGLSSHPHVTAVNASFMVTEGDLSSLYSAVRSPANASSPALTPLVPNQDAPKTPSQPVGSEGTPPSDQPAENDANQNMELLIQKLQVFVEQNATQATRAAKVKPKKTRGHRPPRLENRVPWIVRVWPNTPIPITFVERDPDYQPNPFLGEKDQAVETTLDGPDPRLDPDRPPFVPAGKSEQATASLALKEKKRLFVSSIRVVRDIPLDLQATIHAGRSIPRDPRQPFRSTVAEMDLELDQAEGEEAGKAAVDFEQGSRNQDDDRQEQQELQMKSAADGSEISSGHAAEVTPSSSGQTSGVALEFKDGRLCSVPGVIRETDDKKTINSKHSASTRSDLPDYAGQSSKARPAEHEGSDSKSLTLVVTPREEAPQVSVSTDETEDGKETSWGRKRPFEYSGASPDISKKPRIASLEEARIHSSADSSRYGGDACCRRLKLVQKIGSYKKETLHKRSRKACMGSAYEDRHDRKESSGGKTGEEENDAIGEKGRDVADLESLGTRMDSRTKLSHSTQSTGVGDKFSRLRDALNEELLNDLLQLELEPDCAEDHKERDQTLAGSRILPGKLRSSHPLTSSPLFLPSFRFREESGSMQEVCGAVSSCHTGRVVANANSLLEEEKAASADTAEFEQCAAVAEAQQIPASANRRRASAVSVETSSLLQGSEVGVGTFKEPSLNPASTPRDKDQREPKDTSHTNSLSKFGTAANEGKMKKTEGCDVGVFTTKEQSVCEMKEDFLCDATERTNPAALSKPVIHAINCSVSCTEDEATTGVLSKSPAGIVNCSVPSDEDESRTGVLSESVESRTGVLSKSVAGVVTCSVSSSEGGTKAGVVNDSLLAGEVERVGALQDGRMNEEESSVLGYGQDDTQEREPLEPEVSQQGPLEPEVSQQGPLEPEVSQQGPLELEVSQQGPLEPEVFQVLDPAVCSTFTYISDKNVDGSFLAGSLHAETVVTAGNDRLSARQDALGENSGADYVYSSSGTERSSCVIGTVVSASLGSAVVSQSRSATIISSEMQTAPWNKIPTIVSPRSMLPDSSVYPPVGWTPTLWMPGEGASQGLSATAVNPSPISHHSCQGNAGLSQMFTSGSPAVIQNVASHTSDKRMLNLGVGMTRYAYQPHYGSVSGTVGLYVGQPVGRQFLPQGGALLNSAAGVNAGSQLRSGCHSLFPGGLPGGVPVPLQQLVMGLPSNNATRTCTPWGAPPGNVTGGSAAWQVPVIQNSSSMVRQTDVAHRMPVNVAASNEADWGTSARTVTGCSFPPMGLRQGAAGNGADSSAALVRNVAMVDSSQRGAHQGLAQAHGRIDSAQSPGSAPPHLPDAAGVEAAWPYCSFQ